MLCKTALTCAAALLSIALASAPSAFASAQPNRHLSSHPLGSTRTSAESVPHRRLAAPAAPVRQQPAVKELLSAINRDRAEHGVPSLTLDKRQSQCSEKHSVHMAREGTISHDQFPDNICATHTRAAENVGVASGSPREALLTLHRMMMNEGPCPKTPCSPRQFEVHGHYINLLNPAFKRIGIGAVVSGGMVWLTENFTG